MNVSYFCLEIKPGIGQDLTVPNQMANVIGHITFFCLIVLTNVNLHCIMNLNWWSRRRKITLSCRYLEYFPCMHVFPIQLCVLKCNFKNLKQFLVLFLYTSFDSFTLVGFLSLPSGYEHIDFSLLKLNEPLCRANSNFKSLECLTMNK